MSLQTLWHTIQAGFAGLGAWLAAYLGGLDGLFYALIIFAIADYITGVLAAINERRISSAVGFRGIARKILIFTLVGLAHLLDTHVIGTPGVLRTADHSHQNRNTDGRHPRRAAHGSHLLLPVQRRHLPFGERHSPRPADPGADA
ncbi:phage holin family protein [Cutibacterium avidum]|uniref:phage holin family protein n=1 Tax=Cutibacterium avidum TaxID=33010 RepID=UPI000A877399|nr:phage holin family protein [Cutibacterium avidum]MDK7699071.1 phage holin family protein [Cutibacterium avidum]